MQKICCLRMSTGRRKDEGEKTKAKRRKDESEKTKRRRRKDEKTKAKRRKDESEKTKRRKRKDEGEKTKRRKRKDESEKTLNSGLQCFRYFVILPSLFRYVAFVISSFRLFAFVFSSFRYGAFVMSPRNNEKTKWHKSATIKIVIVLCQELNDFYCQNTGTYNPFKCMKCFVRMVDCVSFILIDFTS